MISRHSLFAAVFATIATFSLACFAETHPQSFEAARTVAAAQAVAKVAAAKHVTVVASAETVGQFVR